MNTQLIYSLITGIFVGGTAAYLGSLMIQKKMSLAAGPLGHLAFPGVALALIYNFDISLGAFPFIILGVILVWILEQKTKVPVDTLTAVIFAVSLAIAFLFLPIHQAEEALVGNISQVSFLATLSSVILSTIIFLAIRSVYKKMIIINISNDLAKVEKINIKKQNFIFLLSLAIIVALGVRLVGALLTVALVSIPVATAKNIAWSLKSYYLLSILFGVLASVIGVILSPVLSWPAGVLIILSSALMFLISIFWQRK